MYIGFIGSHGTGKTTTAEELSSMMDIPFLGSTARTASAYGLEVNQEATMMSQLLVTVSRANQVLGGFDSKDLITDRTALDSYAYTTYQADYVWPSDSSMRWYIDQSWRLVQNAMKKYDSLFFFPILWAPKEDGLRKTDLKYQAAIDDRLRMFIRESTLNNIVVMPPGTPTERAHFIQASVLPVMV